MNNGFLQVYKVFTSVLTAVLIVVFSLTGPAVHAEDMPIGIYSLDINIDVERSTLKGLSRIMVEQGRELLLRTGSLKIRDVSMNNKKLDVTVEKGLLRIIPPYKGEIQIRYEGSFKSTASRKHLKSGNSENSIGERGVSLTGLWYPSPQRLSYYKLKVKLPEGYEAISEADTIIKTVKNGSAEFTFTFPYPLDSVNLIASEKFKIIKDRHGSTELYMYVFLKDLSLAETYLAFTKKYLSLYESMIGPYPYKRFSVVENFLPTGYSMPTFTLLGESVVRLPFIVETSLGHEILHQWFGNSVYTDYSRGNWAEGLTTYLADHFYKEQEGEDRDSRKQMLIRYNSYVTEGNEISIRDFQAPVGQSARAVGYGKVAMVFHMLRHQAGEEAFFKALKQFVTDYRFHSASWEDLMYSFERVHQKDLQWFFSQWIDKKGLPELSLDTAEVYSSEGGYTLNVNITQSGTPYNLSVPLTLYFAEGKSMKRFFTISKEKNNFTIFLSQKPIRLVLDEDYDVARMLTAPEFPPVISRILGEKNLIIYLPQGRKRTYRSILRTFREQNALIKKAKNFSYEDVRSSSILILGHDNPVIQKIFGVHEGKESGFSIVMRQNPWNDTKVIGIIHGESREEVDAAFPKISHFGKYSQLFFENGRTREKTIRKSQRGMAVTLTTEPSAVDISTITRLPAIIDKVSERKIIYVGEMHDVFAHHAVQLDIISGIYKKNKKIAIGMEMFQKPFQPTLDKFISGSIDEKEFLKKSEYFKRWAFDYNLYKPILDFARSRAIPVVALNIGREIIDTVSQSGLGSLSGKDRKVIPPDMDFSDTGYKKRIFEVFRFHTGWKDKNFIFFYQSQILWDETMSLSIVDFLNTNPDYQIIVLAGQGHLMYGSGIPKRTFRRNGFAYATILIDSDVEDSIADFVVFPKPVKGMTAPKLMAFLKREDSRLTISGFPHGSISEKAGLQSGDTILSLDEMPIEGIDNIKFLLQFKKKGERVKIKVLRKDEELEKERTMEFDIVL